MRLYRKAPLLSHAHDAAGFLYQDRIVCPRTRGTLPPRMPLLFGVCLVASLLLVPFLRAQSRSPLGPQQHSLGQATVAALSASAGSVQANPLSTDTTDTGAFALGHRDFSRYDTPGLCRAAARWTYDLAQLRLVTQLRRDTLGRGDTTGVGAVATVARACGAHFTLATTPARDRSDLFDLALFEQNDSLSLAVLAAMVMQASTPQERDSDYINAVQAYLAFGRLAAAETVVAQVAARGAVTGTAPSFLHYLLRDFLDEREDTLRAQQEAEREIADGEKQSNRTSGYRSVLDGYRDLMRLVFLGNPAAMQAVAQHAKRDMSLYTYKDQVTTIFRRYHDWGHLPLDSVIALLAPQWYADVHLNGGGPPAPRLQADYWFPAPGRPAGDTVFPVPGHVNLICMGSEPTGFFETVFGRQQDAGYTLAAHIRRWLRLYGTDGLTVALVDVARGYQEVYESPVAVFATPADAASLWRWYEQDYHRLPVTVAVQMEQTTAWLPPFDGRRLRVSSVQYQHYLDAVDALTADYARGARRSAGPGSCTIIGRTGAILYSGLGWGPSYTGTNVANVFIGEHNVYDEILHWLFRGPGATLSSVSASVGSAPLPTAQQPEVK
jgi:hypothetical protein